MRRQLAAVAISTLLVWRSWWRRRCRRSWTRRHLCEIWEHQLLTIQRWINSIFCPKRRWRRCLMLPWIHTAFPLLQQSWQI